MNIANIRRGQVLRTTEPLGAGSIQLPQGLAGEVVRIDNANSEVVLRTRRGNEFVITSDVLEPVPGARGGAGGGNGGSTFVNNPGTGGTGRAGRTGNGGRPGRPNLLNTDNYRPGAQVLYTTRTGRTLPATLEGHDYRDQAVVRVGNRVEHVPFQAVAPDPSSAPAVVRSPGDVLLEGLSPGQIRRANPVIREALNIALGRRIVGRHTAQEYVDALRRNGHSVALVGGAIRDVIQALKENPQVSARQLSRMFADLDLVTTATPSEVRAISERIAPEVRGGGIWSGRNVERFGIIGIGQRKDGLDIASLKSGPPGQAVFTFGKRLADDASSRDFTINQLYFLYDQGTLVDPSGTGIVDAENRRIRVNSEAPFSNEMLSMRFFKFRIKGYGTDEQTKRLMRRHVEGVWPRLTSGITGSFLRCIPSDCNDRRALRQFIGQFEQAMQRDGMGDLFNRFLRPRIREIEAEFARRNGGR